MCIVVESTFPPAAFVFMPRDSFGSEERVVMSTSMLKQLGVKSKVFTIHPMNLSAMVLTSKLPELTSTAATKIVGIARDSGVIGLHGEILVSPREPAWKPVLDLAIAEGHRSATISETLRRRRVQEVLNKLEAVHETTSTGIEDVLTWMSNFKTQ